MALSDNLTFAWELNEASGDAIDSHSTADLTDHNTVGSGTGLVYANARDFEVDNSEYFSHSDLSDLSGDIDCTFEAWVNAESSSAARGVLGVDDTPGGGNRSFILTLFLLGSSADWLVSGDGGTFSTVSAGTLSTATWYQVICWHDAGANQIGIAVNAGSAATASHSTGIFNSTADFQIGAFRTTTYFDGLIGPVRYWKRVLTSDERTELYNSGAGRDYDYITGGGGGFVAFPHPRGAYAGMMMADGGVSA